MAFVPVNPLEESLIAAATNPAARPEFYRTLVQEDLFLITDGRMPAQAGRIVADEKTSLQIRMLEIDGKPHTPVFTSVQRISAVVPQEVGFVAMRGGSSACHAARSGFGDESRGRVRQDSDGGRGRIDH